MKLDPTRRGWIRTSPRHSEKMQREALEAAGAGVIYDADTEDMPEFLRRVRRGDTVLVTTLARLTSKRRDLRTILDAIHAKRAVVLEVKTGRRSDRVADAANMVLDAISEQSGDAQTATPEEAAKRGRKGAKALRKNAAARRTSKAEALVAWRSLGLTIPQALATESMDGWTLATAYRILKRRNTARGAVIGRPRKIK